MKSQSPIYSQGWLQRFLDPSNQPQEVKEYLEQENKILFQKVSCGSTLIDFGCGFGRHLEMLAQKLIHGQGIDTNEQDIERARDIVQKKFPHLQFEVDDIRKTRTGIFDYAICMNSTLGNVHQPEEVIATMRRAVHGGVLLAGVYGENSTKPRVEWYRRTGLKVSEVTKTGIKTSEGHFSYTFSQRKIRELFGQECHIIPLGTFGYFVEAY